MFSPGFRPFFLRPRVCTVPADGRTNMAIRYGYAYLAFIFFNIHGMGLELYSITVAESCICFL